MSDIQSYCNFPVSKYPAFPDISYILLRIFRIRIILYGIHPNPDPDLLEIRFLPHNYIANASLSWPTCVSCSYRHQFLFFHFNFDLYFTKTIWYDIIFVLLTGKCLIIVYLVLSFNFYNICGKSFLLVDYTPLCAILSMDD